MTNHSNLRATDTGVALPTNDNDKIIHLKEPIPFFCLLLVRDQAILKYQSLHALTEGLLLLCAELARGMEARDALRTTREYRGHETIRPPVTDERNPAKLVIDLARKSGQITIYANNDPNAR